MKTIKEEVDSKIKESMKNGDKESLKTLRMLKSSFLNAEKENGEELNYQNEVQIVNKLIKQRKESAQIYYDKGEEEKGEEEYSQIHVLEQFLPHQMSEEEIEKTIDKIINELSASSI